MARHRSLRHMDLSEELDDGGDFFQDDDDDYEDMSTHDDGTFHTAQHENEKAMQLIASRPSEVLEYGLPIKMVEKKKKKAKKNKHSATQTNTSGNGKTESLKSANHSDTDVQKCKVDDQISNTAHVLEMNYHALPFSKSQNTETSLAATPILIRSIASVDDLRSTVDSNTQIGRSASSISLANLSESSKIVAHEVPKANFARTRTSIESAQREKWMAERQLLITEETSKLNDQLAHINLCVVGHVDAGKSTLMGHLLYLCGRVNQKTLRKYEKDSKAQGKSSFAFAWILDEHEEERSRGVTIDIAVNWFDTPTKHVTLLDAPGHRDFIPNMISGVAQADNALLVVPAVIGEFEAAFSDDGQTKEHAILSRALGINSLIVVINKLDAVNWSQQRYIEIRDTMLQFLKNTGFKERDVQFVPASGLSGENIVALREPLLSTWYTGPTLLDMIDNLQLPKRCSDKPLRMSVSDVYRTQVLGTTLSGKLETGSVVAGDVLLVLPIGEQITVKGIDVNGTKVRIAQAGDNVELGVRDIIDSNMLQIGQWLCPVDAPIPLVSYFRAQIITLSYKVPLLRGTSVVFINGNTSEPVTISKLLAILNKATGTIEKKAPRMLPRQCSALVEIAAKRSICVELFRECRELGRFTLRRGNETVAAGVITQLFRL